MLLETVAKSFKQVTIQKLRELATSRLHKLALAEDAQQPSAADYPQRKVFSEFVGSLLDTSLNTLSRLMYILKLLNISKSLSQGGGTNPSESGSGSRSSIPFSSHEADRRNSSGLRGNTARLLLALWSSIEDMVIHEIKVHLADPDVENITDHQHNKSQLDLLHSASEDLPEQHKALSRELSSKGFGSSSRDEYGALDDEAFQYEKSYLIFKPTSRHGATVYKMVVSYSQAVERIMRENDLYEYAAGLAAGPDATTWGLNPAILLSKATNTRTAGSLTVMESLALQTMQNKGKSGASMPNKILLMIEKFLEEELIPVIQSTVNNVMRDIQLNSSYFTVSLDRQSVNQHPININSTAVSSAAELCMEAVQPLFSYWLQLSQRQHRIMISTVIERAIRGYAAAAREELESLSYNMMSSISSQQVTATACFTLLPLCLNSALTARCEEQVRRQEHNHRGHQVRPTISGLPTESLRRQADSGRHDSGVQQQCERRGGHSSRQQDPDVAGFSGRIQLVHLQQRPGDICVVHFVGCEQCFVSDQQLLLREGSSFSFACNCDLFCLILFFYRFLQTIIV